MNFYSLEHLEIVVKLIYDVDRGALFRKRSCNKLPKKDQGIKDI